MHRRQSGGRWTHAQTHPGPDGQLVIEELEHPALVGKELTDENIAAATALIDGDLGSDIMSDIFASAEYRRAMAAIELKHAIFHATGLAHH